MYFSGFATILEMNSAMLFRDRAVPVSCSPSANYFGDLVKKETGKTAQEYIHANLIDAAKEKIFNPAKTVSEVAYELGFKYPQHFTRFFKQQVGSTPNEYRSSQN